MRQMMTEDHQNQGNLPSDGDNALLQRLFAGEKDAATSLYERYAERLQRLADYQTSEALSHKVSSEEIVQTVFRTFFRRAANDNYCVAEGEDLWKLLLVIALNKIRTYAEYHRAQKRDLNRTQVYSPDYFEGKAQAEGDESVSYSLLKLTINELVEVLPSDYRQIVQLRIEGNTVPEISQKAGRAKRTVERMLQEFRTRLLDEIADPE